MKNRRKAGVLIFIIVYSVLLGLLLYGNNFFLRDANKYELMNHVNLEPFVEIKRYYNAIATESLPLGTVLANLLGNLVLFVPLVVAMQIGFETFRKWYIAIPVFAIIICLVEYMQYTTRRGSCDIDDIILNFTGVCVAYLVTAIIFRLRKAE